jgi:hypothetical protein
VSVVRRRSRRRKSSYRDQDAAAAELWIDDLSPRAKRLVESGVIDLSTVVGSGDDGRITSGDILERARLMEKEQSVARIETIGHSQDVTQGEDELPAAQETGDAATPPADLDQQETADEPPSVAYPAPLVPESGEAMSDPDPTIVPPAGPIADAPAATDGESATSTSVAYVGGEPIGVPPTPWDAYNGSTDGLAERALPGAEQSWGEAEANIAAIAEEAAAQLYQRPDSPSERAVTEPVHSFSEEPESEPAPDLADDELSAVGPVAEAEPVFVNDEAAVFDPIGATGPAAHDTFDAAETVDRGVEGDSGPATEPYVDEASPVPKEPIGEVASMVTTGDEARAIFDEMDPVAEAGNPGLEQLSEVMMDFGTLELVDPDSVWDAGAEDFAPWFLANSKQLGEVLGLETGLSDPRQYTTKSATGVLGRDDNGEDVVVVSSQHAAADDSDLGRALGMAASSGAATVALVSAKFGEEQLQALAWLNSQTKSGVKWFGIEMKVVRIADSPPAMMFNLVASPSTG